MSGAQRSEKMFILAWGQSGLHSADTYIQIRSVLYVDASHAVSLSGLSGV